jgi:hypothetical protein
MAFPVTSVVIVLQFLIFLVLYIAIYRLSFHPLASVPGPWLAAITRLYHFYYSVIRRGDVVNHLKYLHKKYGEEWT